MDDYAARYARRNFILGVANGVIFMAGSALLDPATILPKYLETIFDSKALIGLGSMLLGIGWQLPQALVAYFLRSLKHRKPAYIAGNATRLLFIALFVVSMVVFGENRAAIGAAYFVFLSLAGLGAGTVGLAYQDIVARTIPPERRGAYNAYRIIGGQGILALAGSILAREILARPETFPYPYNYVLIFGFAWSVMSIGVATFSFMKEPEEKAVKSRPRFKSFLFEMYLIVKRDVTLKTFLVVRMLRSFELLATSFYIVFATSVLGLPEKVAGTFLTIRLATTFVAALLWGWLSDHKGTKLVTRLSAIASGIAPALALIVALLVAVPAAPGASEAASPAAAAGAAGQDRAVLRHFGAVEGWLPVAIMAPVFVLMTLGGIGSWIGPQNYLMEIAPARRRPLYIGLSTTFDGILVLVIPAIGGAMIDAVNSATSARVPGYTVTFFVACILTLTSASMAARLREPRLIVTR